MTNYRSWGNIAVCQKLAMILESADAGKLSFDEEAALLEISSDINFRMAKATDIMSQQVFARDQAKLKAKQGFTLIELGIVIAFIGIICAIALPNLLMAKRKHEAEHAAQTAQAAPAPPTFAVAPANGTYVYRQEQWTVTIATDTTTHMQYVMLNLTPTERAP